MTFTVVLQHISTGYLDRRQEMATASNDNPQNAAVEWPQSGNLKRAFYCYHFGKILCRPTKWPTLYKKYIKMEERGPFWQRHAQLRNQLSKILLLLYFVQTSTHSKPSIPIKGSKHTASQSLTSCSLVAVYGFHKTRFLPNDKAIARGTCQCTKYTHTFMPIIKWKSYATKESVRVKRSLIDNGIKDSTSPCAYQQVTILQVLGVRKKGVQICQSCLCAAHLE